MGAYQITEKEYRVIDEVSRNNRLTQREVSRKVGISLGMANLILKRLARRGYIKVRGLNRRGLEYLLTPKGFAQKTEKSYRYFLMTINLLKKTKRKVQELVSEEYSRGQRKFIILGKGELADLIEISLRDLDKRNLKFKRVVEKEAIGNPCTATVLVAEEDLGPEEWEAEGRKPARCLNIVAHITDMFSSSP